MHFDGILKGCDKPELSSSRRNDSTALPVNQLLSCLSLSLGVMSFFICFWYLKIVFWKCLSRLELTYQQRFMTDEPITAGVNLFLSKDRDSANIVQDAIEHISKFLRTLKTSN